MTSSLADRIKAFEEVRDVPYHIDLLHRDLDHSCVGKRKLLQAKLAAIGIDSRPICCTFRWDTTPLPSEIFAKASRPTSGHEFLEAFIPENKKWVWVDPTWDSSLKTAGFPIAEWDGLNPTILAVTHDTIFSADISATMVEGDANVRQEDWRDLHELLAPFLNDFHPWLERRRSLGALHA